jgi:hypothetical protein
MEDDKTIEVSNKIKKINKVFLTAVVTGEAQPIIGQQAESSAPLCWRNIVIYSILNYSSNLLTKTAKNPVPRNNNKGESKGVWCNKSTAPRRGDSIGGQWLVKPKTLE